MVSEINDFIRETLAKGASKDDIRVALKEAGWPDEEITSELSAFGDSAIAGIPVPRRKPYTSAKEGFLYLLTFVTLYISACNFGALIFDFINMLYPDTLYDYSDMSAIRFNVASLIVAFPIYFWLTIKTHQAIIKDPAKGASRVRKWLIHFTLFIAATIIICDLIGLLVGLLGGDLTTRFFLKVATIFFISAIVFGYYRWDLNSTERDGE